MSSILRHAAKVRSPPPHSGPPRTGCAGCGPLTVCVGIRRRKTAIGLPRAAIKLLVFPSFGLRRLPCCVLFTQEIVMLETSPTRAVCLAKLSQRLQSECYVRKVVSNYPSCVDRFLDYLEGKGLTVYSVQPTEVDRYLKVLRMVRKRPGCLARKGLRSTHRAAIHILLRLLHEQWPPVPAPVNEAESLRRQLVAAYDAWLNEVHGIADNTRYSRCAEALRLLAWWDDRASGNPLWRLSVSDLDAFLQWRSSRWSRGSIGVVVASMRSFLRYLHESGQVPVDLSAAIHGPRVYALDRIISAYPAQD